ncbi:Transposon Tf2-6 polyprotein, partial [Dictyocoela roeselum]
MLKRHQVSINFEKCIFDVEKINYLGHEISKDGIRPNISKLKGFEFKTLRSKKQLEKILGFVNWYRPFIQNLSTITALLYDKLKGKDKKISWSKNDTEILAELKAKPLLHQVNLNEPFKLKCDASENGIGRVLFQKGQIIGIYSKKFNTQEVSKTIPEKEALAILKSVDHFKHLVYNSKIIIQTDNKNFIFKGLLTKRLNRMKMLLEEFDYELEYIEGQRNKEADQVERQRTRERR